ncbi:hypothetical protein HT031_004362 [Scenedesmus sp. PABB004]|nr:hypothetical protein HT031_004362 [Scenedesmus sp. PABB004]
MIVKVSQVPDWERRAMRLSLGLAFFTSLSLTLWLVPERFRAEWGDEVAQSCVWAGATCAVVAASPLIGKVAQLSSERTLGTLLGGLLGFLVYDYGVLMLPATEAVQAGFMVACAAGVGALSCWLSMKFKLDASMRLFVITFIIVTFGAHNASSESAAGVALLRTGGIIAGVLVLMTLTLVILPKSATIESLREMKNGLKLLTELNTLVWTSRTEAEAAMKQAAAAAREAEAAAAATAAAADAAHAGGRALARLLSSSSAQRGEYARLPNGPTAADLEAGAAPGPAACAGGSGGAGRISQLTRALQGGAGGGPAPPPAKPQSGAPAGLAGAPGGPALSYDQIMEKYEERCEGVLTAVYQSMFKVKELMGVAESEVYVHHCYGHYVFVPALFFTRAAVDWALPRRWRLPAAALEELATSVRIIARLLWTVHLEYSQGFDDVLAALPPAACMANLLEELGRLMAASLGVLIEAFPNKDSILVDDFSKLGALVDRMLEVCEAQHAHLITDLAANRPKAHRAARAGSPPASPHATLGGAFDGAAALLPPTPPRQVAFVTFDSVTGAAGAAGAAGAPHLYDSLTLEGLPGPLPAESPPLASPDGTLFRLSGLGSLPGGGSDGGGGADAARALLLSRTASDLGPAAAQAAPAAALGTAASGPTGSLIRSKFKPHAVLAAVRLARSSAAARPLGGGLTPPPCAAPAAPAPAAHTVAGAAAGGGGGVAPSPGAAPAAGSPGGAGGAAALASAAMAAPGGSSDEAPRGAMDLGFVKLTRWYSFVFLVSELYDELDRLYCATRNVLGALPHGL